MAVAIAGFPTMVVYEVALRLRNAAMAMAALAIRGARWAAPHIKQGAETLCVKGGLWVASRLTEGVKALYGFIKGMMESKLREVHLKHLRKEGIHVLGDGTWIVEQRWGKKPLHVSRDGLIPPE